MCIYFLFGIGLFIISILTRIWVRFLRRDFGIDTWYFLNYAECFRKEKKLPAKLNHYLLDIEEQWYPPFLAFVLSLIPKWLADRYHWLISAVIDSFQAILLYIFSIILTGRFDIAVFATLFYITSTINASMATNLNARPLASAVLTLLMLSLYLFSTRPNIFSFILILILGAILLHTHKMATQQFLFFAIGLAILMQDIFYIFILFSIFLASLLATKGFYIKILKNNFEIVKYWSRNLPYLWNHQVYESTLYKNEKKAINRKGVSGLKTHRIMFLIARVQLILFIFIIILLWISKKNVSQVNNLSFLFYWAFINYFTVITTTYLPFFKFIGEGFKYLIYGTFPTSFLVTYAAMNLIPNIIVSYFILLILIAIDLFVQVFTLSRQMLNVNSFVDDELKEVIDILKKSKEDKVMCIPVFKAEPIAYLANKKVLWGGHGSGWDRLNEFYPLIRTPIEQLIKKYKIDFLLLDKRFVDFDDLKIGKRFNKIFEGKNYIFAKII